jgi:hypothetical protein
MCSVRIRDGLPARNIERELALNDGQNFLGHIVSKDKRAFEAVDATGKSLGIFASQAAAIAALGGER